MHISVMTKELIDNLAIKDNGVYIDCTFGAGGHTTKILESNSTAKVIGLDRDENAILVAQNLKKRF